MRSENQIGDIITSVDGQPLKDPGDLARIVGSHKPGDQVTLGVLRQGHQQQLQVTLGDRPTDMPERRRRGGPFDWLR